MGRFSPSQIGEMPATSKQSILANEAEANILFTALSAGSSLSVCEEG